MAVSHHLLYHVLKVRKLEPAQLDEVLGEAPIKLRFERYLASLSPAFVGEMVLRCSPDIARESPSLHFKNPEEVNWFSNLGVNLDFGIRTLRDPTAAGYRILFSFIFPEIRKDRAVIVVVNFASGQRDRHMVGRVHAAGKNATIKLKPEFELPPLRSTSGEKRLYFIGGAPKSGTTWMQILLNEHPDCLALGEGEFWNTMDQVHVQRKNCWFPPDMKLADLRDIYNLGGNRVIAHYHARIANVSCVVDKNPGYATQYEHILELMPETRFIHCVRHPLDVIVSRFHHEIKRLGAGAVDDEIERHRQALGELNQQLAANGRLAICDADEAQWNLTLDIANEWISFQRQAVWVRKTHPDQILVARYEDMMARGEEITEQLFRFFDLDADPEIVRLCVKGASFENLTKRSPGTENRASFFRVGRSNQYLEAFEPRALAHLMAHIRDRLDPGESERDFAYDVEAQGV